MQCWNVSLNFEHRLHGVKAVRIKGWRVMGQSCNGAVIDMLAGSTSTWSPHNVPGGATIRTVNCCFSAGVWNVGKECNVLEQDPEDIEMQSMIACVTMIHWTGLSETLTVADIIFLHFPTFLG